MSTSAPAPCIVCGAALQSLVPGDIPQPAGAVVFYGSPGFGSDFDGLRSENQLEISVCDGCLLKHCDRVTHVTVLREERTLRWTWEPSPQGVADGCT